jgi:1,4-alpha-glucan branching enzyme
VVLPGRNDTPDAPRVTASAPQSPATTASPTAPAALAARDAGATTLRPVQLVFRAPAASRVSVVGDFSGWDPNSAVMTRDSGSGLWSVTLRLAPGRHVYAFLVDDSIWVRDPRAPSAPDADFGRPGSVLLVGQP